MTKKNSVILTALFLIFSCGKDEEADVSSANSMNQPGTEYNSNNSTKQDTSSSDNSPAEPSSNPPVIGLTEGSEDGEQDGPVTMGKPEESEEEETASTEEEETASTEEEAVEEETASTEEDDEEAVEEEMASTKEEDAEVVEEETASNSKTSDMKAQGWA